MMVQLRNHMNCASDAFHPGNSKCVKSTAPAPLRPTYVFLGWGWPSRLCYTKWLIEDYGRAKSRNLDRPDRSSRFLLGHISMPFAWGRLGPKDPSFRFGAKHPSFPHDIIIFVKYIPFVFFLLFMMPVVKKAYTHWRVRTCLRPLNVQISTYS